MSITPIDASSIPEQVTPDVSFDNAVKTAQEDSEALDQVFEKGIGMMAQTILTPRMNEILSESMSDE